VQKTVREFEDYLSKLDTACFTQMKGGAVEVATHDVSPHGECLDPPSRNESPYFCDAHPTPELKEKSPESDRLPAKQA
jgi:hypothetical protein